MDSKLARSSPRANGVEFARYLAGNGDKYTTRPGPGGVRREPMPHDWVQHAKAMRTAANNAKWGKVND